MSFGVALIAKAKEILENTVKDNTFFERWVAHHMKAMKKPATFVKFPALPPLSALLVATSAAASASALASASASGLV